MISSLVNRTRLAGFAGVALVLASLPAAAETAPTPSPSQTPAKQVILVDAESGAILFEKNADEAFPPASLAKLMTMEIVFEALKKGSLRLDQSFAVSTHAWRTGGAPSGTSTMFAKVNSQVPLEALIRGVVIQSANDAAIAIAEGMAGSEEGFARLMNARAAELGMKGSHFVNPTGLPAEGQRVTARDLAILARHIEEAHPDQYKIYAETSFEWNKILQRSRNPLLGMNIGAEGMEIGFSEGYGYALVGVTRKDGRVTLLATGGLASAKERAAESRRLLEWAATDFRREVLFEPGTVVGRAEVFGGTASSVSLRPKLPVVAFVPNAAADTVKARIFYDGPLLAPIRTGDKIGRVEIQVDGKTSITEDLFAGETVEQGTFADRALGAAQELAFGWIRTL
ncbi:D-alanyl-D-alanine carboxypeptidase family protein [Mangrovicella endophytica]|uniref:D-alanyl-D-alanine carboxypeptidase family protein n=1 Tax=Mangrovicella endophytica TaxID=2066697 RepID=UPI000C9E45C9|nr:D-alanyl-D-alanine carboxypeptidase family protein [Mangrovicella endophytica]